MAVDIQTIAVLGAGVMGHGIASLCAGAGYETRLFDIESTLLEQGMSRARGWLDKAVARGRLDASRLEAANARLSAATTLAAAGAGADLVIEAVPENLALKKELFAQVSQVVGPDCLLATNTSSLPVTEIASAATLPERVVGLHFFNPPPVMPLLEVVVGERTVPLAEAAARAFGARVGKEVVVVRDSPGFATSRLGVAIALEAMRMLEEGVAPPEEIDRAMKLGYGFPMGPLELTDLVGLDVRLSIAQHLSEELGERFRPPQILRRLVRAGKLGKKSGEGFYKY